MQEDELKKAMDALARDGIRIPPQPKVLIDYGKLLVKVDYDTRALAKVLMQDPGIVATLFKAARSPAFSRGKKFSSLEQVLLVVGVKQVYNLVQAAALTSAISDSKRKSFDVFWTRAKEMAELASMIAGDHLSACNVFPEQAYMAGVFHECGVPVLMMRFPKYCETLHLDDVSCWPNLAEENQKFNVDHCSIGYIVARHWGLPDFVCQAIRFHHELPDDQLGATVTLMCILQLAIHFYHRINNQPNVLWDKIGPRVLEEIGMTSDEEEDYFDSINSRFLEAVNAED
jgi:HD-like signal output (HDOD) protein